MVITTLYFCRACAVLLGDDAEHSDNVEDGKCLNCDSDGPHIAGQFTEVDATTLMNTRYDQ